VLRRNHAPQTEGKFVYVALDERHRASVRADNGGVGEISARA
jgi:hypothetical protein